ncbi:MAG TPA: polymer-forming cytoskeletal protein [Candidatus Acidoferrales bacterium]
MWRKNQEPQPSAPVPAKNQPPKAETTRPLASNPQSSAPEPVKAEFATSVPPAPLPAPVVAPPSPAPAPTAPIYSPAPLPANVDSRIGPGLKIRGEITGSSDMYIDGDVQGTVRVGSGRLTVGPNGRVQADLEAREIVVNGTVLGNLKATDRVQLGSSGSVQGGVVTPRIGIDDGARLRGNVETARAGEPTGTPAKSSEKEALRALVATKGE